LDLSYFYLIKMNDLPVELQNRIYIYVKSDTANLIKDYIECVQKIDNILCNSDTELVWVIQENRELGFKTFNKDRYLFICKYGCYNCSCELIKQHMNYPVKDSLYCYYCKDCWENLFSN
jgi:hypothetical protein